MLANNCLSYCKATEGCGLPNNKVGVVVVWGGGGARKVAAPHVLGPIGICVRRSVKGGGNLIIGAAFYIDGGGGGRPPPPPPPNAMVDPPLSATEGKHSKQESNTPSLCFHIAVM